MGQEPGPCPASKRTFFYFRSYCKQDNQYKLINNLSGRHQMRLDGMVSIVTGAASGNGRGIALRFAEEGAVVVVADIDRSGGEETVSMVQDKGSEAVFFDCDVSNASDVRKMTRAAYDRLGRIDVLVNNAGISPVGSVTEISEEEWDQCLDIDLKSVFLGCKYAIPLMIEGDGGAIVNVAGTLGLRATHRKAAYCAAKAGVINLTRQVALDYGDDGIRINSICPGFIETPLTESVSAELRQHIVDTLPLARTGQVEDIASAAVYLASSESAYVTGSYILVDGGQMTAIPA
jgi:NAD(P)-dependent dehydrogenase (short-subunit alcohol dehydrogenase family)